MSERTRNMKKNFHLRKVCFSDRPVSFRDKYGLNNAAIARRRKKHKMFWQQGSKILPDFLHPTRNPQLNKSLSNK